MLDYLIALLVSLALIAIGLAFGVLAFHGIYHNFRARRDAGRSRHWSVAPGRVVSTMIIWVGARARSPRPQIQYTYLVNGVAYDGSRIAFEFSRIYARQQAEKLIQRYPVDLPVQVYYDPEHPNQSTLEQTHHGVAFGLLVSVVLLLSPTGFCICMGLVGLASTLPK